MSDRRKAEYVRAKREALGMAEAKAKVEKVRQQMLRDAKEKALGLHNDSTSLIPEQHCPGCGLYVCESTHLLFEGAKPKPGDFTVCIQCAIFLRLDNELKNQIATPEEVHNARSKDWWPTLDATRGFILGEIEGKLKK